MKTSSFLRHFVIVSVLALLIMAPLASAQEGSRSMTMVLSRDPISFDPHGRLDPSGPVILSYVYDTLLYQNEHGEIVPMLAADWAIAEDNSTLTFNLRQDVVFSNGVPFNADSVVFTFERLKEVGQSSLIYGEIANVSEFEKVDDFTVVFHLNEPSVTLLSALTYAYAALLEPSAVEAAGEDYGTNPVGTGPYVLADWIPQNSLTLVANPLYNGHRPIDEEAGPVAIDELQIRFTTDQMTRVNALQAGEVDVAYLTSSPLIEQMAANDNFHIMDNPARGLLFAGFNTGEGSVFNDVRLRQAVAHAINKQDVLDIAKDGLGVVVNTPLPPTIFGYDANLEAEALTYDPAAGRDLVAEAGYGPDNPVQVTILTSTFPTYDTMATVIQAQLAEIGIQAEVQVLDFGGMIAAANAGEYDIVVTRFDWNDPDLLRVYLSEASIGSGNRYFYANPALDALTTQGRQEFDPDARMAIYAEAQRILMQDVPWVPLHMAITKVVVNNRIHDADMVHSHVALENAFLTD